MMDFKKVPTYTKEQIAHWMDFCAMKDASLPFPDCMATGWFNRFNHREWKPDHPEYGVVTLVLNMQKKKVIDAVVKRNKERVEAIEKRNPDFKFEFDIILALKITSRLTISLSLLISFIDFT